MTGRVIVAGGGLAGWRTARELRAAGFAGEIVLLGAEAHLPYDRPPLSKQLLAGAVDPSGIALADEAETARLDVDVRLGVALTGIDPAARQVRTAAGEVLAYDRLVIATGADPRRLPFPAPGVHTLRTVEDALAIRAGFAPGARLVVVGGGLIAFEVASVASAAGVESTIVEALAAPLMRSVGAELGGRLADTAREHGVTVRCPAGVVAVQRTPSGSRVHLDDGTVLAADVVVAAIGARPAVGWLAGSGLPVDGAGLRCDRNGMVDRDGRIWGVGDVAAWWDPVAGRYRRHEHWTRAVEQAAAVAVHLGAGTGAPAEAVPYFWSDQFGHRVQGVGTHEGHSEVHVDGPVTIFGRDGLITGAVVVDRPRMLAGLRRAIRDRRRFADVRATQADGSVSVDGPMRSTRCAVSAPVTGPT